MDKRLDFYKEQYYFELSRKSQLSNSMSIPIGFLSAVFTALAYFGLNINCIANHWTLWVFIPFIGIAIFFTIRASYNLYKTFIGLKYGYNPSPIKLYEFEKKHINDPDIDEKFFNGIKKSYVNTTTANRKNNNIRADRLYKTNANTIIAILFIIISAVPFFIGKNVNEIKNNNRLIKNQLIMLQDDEKNDQTSEGEDLPSDPESTDFPTDEWINESLNFDIPLETKDSDSSDTKSSDDSTMTKSSEE